MEKKKLTWGQTPWDDPSREELLREVQRLFAALESAASVLHLFKVQDEDSLFWKELGSGDRALGRAYQVIDAVYATYDEESVYRSFFRYASSLLFNVPDDERWVICPAYKTLWSGYGVGTFIGAVCGTYPYTTDNTCQGILRPLAWEDFAKTQGEKQ